MWGRGMAGGIFGIAMGVSAANDGRLPVAVPLEIGGLSWLGLMLVFCFTRAGKRQDALAGTLAALCGVSAIALGLQVSSSPDRDPSSPPPGWC
jgi:hypothetical protein